MISCCFSLSSFLRLRGLDKKIEGIVEIREREGLLNEVGSRLQRGSPLCFSFSLVLYIALVELSVFRLQKQRLITWL